MASPRDYKSYKECTSLALEPVQPRAYGRNVPPSAMDARPMPVSYRPKSHNAPGPVLTEQRSPGAAALDYITSPVKYLSSNVSSLLYKGKTNNKDPPGAKPQAQKPRGPKIAERYLPKSSKPAVSEPAFATSEKPRPIVITSKPEAPTKPTDIETTVQRPAKKGKETRRRHGSQGGSDSEAWRRMNARKPSKARSKNRHNSRSPQNVFSTRSTTAADRPQSFSDNVVNPGTPSGQANTNIVRINTHNDLDYSEKQKSKEEKGRNESPWAKFRNAKREKLKSPKRGRSRSSSREVRRNRWNTPAKTVVQPKIAMANGPNQNKERFTAADSGGKWASDIQPTLIPENDILVEHCRIDNDTKSEPITQYRKNKINDAHNFHMNNAKTNDTKTSDESHYSNQNSINEGNKVTHRRSHSPNESNRIHTSGMPSPRRDGMSHSPISSTAVQVMQTPPHHGGRSSPPRSAISAGKLNIDNTEHNGEQGRGACEITKKDKAKHKKNDFYNKYQHQRTTHNDKPVYNRDDFQEGDPGNPGIFGKLTKFISGFLDEPHADSESGTVLPYSNRNFSDKHQSRIDEPIPKLCRSPEFNMKADLGRNHRVDDLNTKLNHPQSLHDETDSGYEGLKSSRSNKYKNHDEHGVRTSESGPEPAQVDMKNQKQIIVTNYNTFKPKPKSAHANDASDSSAYQTKAVGEIGKRSPNLSDKRTEISKRHENVSDKHAQPVKPEVSSDKTKLHSGKKESQSKSNREEPNMQLLRNSYGKQDPEALTKSLASPFSPSAVMENTKADIHKHHDMTVESINDTNKTIDNKTDSLDMAEYNVDSISEGPVSSEFQKDNSNCEPVESLVEKNIESFSVSLKDHLGTPQINQIASMHTKQNLKYEGELFIGQPLVKKKDSKHIGTNILTQPPEVRVNYRPRDKSPPNWVAQHKPYLAKQELSYPKSERPQTKQQSLTAGVPFYNTTVASRSPGPGQGLFSGYQMTSYSKSFMPPRLQCNMLEDHFESEADMPSYVDGMSVKNKDNVKKIDEFKADNSPVAGLSLSSEDLVSGILSRARGDNVPPFECQLVSNNGQYNNKLENETSISALIKRSDEENSLSHNMNISRMSNQAVNLSQTDRARISRRDFASTSHVPTTATGKKLYNPFSETVPFINTPWISKPLANVPSTLPANILEPTNKLGNDSNSISSDILRPATILQHPYQDDDSDSNNAPLFQRLVDNITNTGRDDKSKRSPITTSFKANKPIPVVTPNREPKQQDKDSSQSKSNETASSKPPILNPKHEGIVAPKPSKKASTSKNKSIKPNTVYHSKKQSEPFNHQHNLESTQVSQASPEPIIEKTLSSRPEKGQYSIKTNKNEKKNDSKTKKPIKSKDSSHFNEPLQPTLIPEPQHHQAHTNASKSKDFRSAPIDMFEPNQDKMKSQYSKDSPTNTGSPILHPTLIPDNNSKIKSQNMSHNSRSKTKLEKGANVKNKKRKRSRNKDKNYQTASTKENTPKITKVKDKSPQMASTSDRSPKITQIKEKSPQPVKQPSARVAMSQNDRNDQNVQSNQKTNGLYGFLQNLFGEVP